MYVRVIVHPNCKKEKVERLKEGAYEVMVKEPAERNLANQRVKELLAREYQVAEKSVRIISGHHSRSKIITINNE